MRKILVPQNSQKKIILNLRNTQEKEIWTHEYKRETNLDPQNTHKKKFQTHEIGKRKNFAPKKYHTGTMAQWH